MFFSMFIQDQVIQIGAKAYGQSVESAFTVYVCPKIAVNPNASSVNGLTNQFLSDQVRLFSFYHCD